VRKIVHYAGQSGRTTGQSGRTTGRSNNISYVDKKSNRFLKKDLFLTFI
jgi:hypothetical protein